MSAPHPSMSAHLPSGKSRRAPTDPRTLRTQTALREALCSLLADKPLDQITVSELTDEAGVNRSTFYLHYANVAEIFTEIEDELFRQYRRFLSRYSDLLARAHTDTQRVIQEASVVLLEETFEFLKAHRDVSPLVMAEGQDNRLLRLIISSGEEVFMADRKALGIRPDSAQARYYFLFLVNGIIGMIKAWMAAGMKETPAEMAALVSHFLMANPPDAKRAMPPASPSSS